MNVSKQLLDEIGKRINKEKPEKIGFSLLYQTNEEADVEEFHKKCDAKGATVTILYGAYDTLFGGYTSKSWNSSTMQKVADEKAFLFKKDENSDDECVFFPIKKYEKDKAIICDKCFGPTFGLGSLKRYDLQAFKKDAKPESKKKGDLLKLNGSLNFKFSYSVDKNDGESRFKANNINSGQMLVTKVEVYQVTDDELEENWLKRLEENVFEEYKKDLIELMPLPGLGIDHYNMMLLGAVGAGKSSFINTVSTVFTGKIETIAQCRQSASSVTNKVQTYDLQSENGETIKIRIFDIRGFESERENEKELKLLLDGRLPDNYQFPDKLEPDDIIYERLNPTLNDKIHSICFVEGNSVFDKYTDAHKERINAIKRMIDTTGLPMVIIATKFDLLCPKISENIGHLFKSPKAEKAAADIADFHGISKNLVLPVVNYVDETTPIKAKDDLALNAIHTIVNTTQAYLKHHTERKKTNFDNWTDRENRLRDWKNDDEKRKIISEILSPFDGRVLKILLVGPVASGKSSFIDSVNSAIQNKIVVHASIGSATVTAENPLSTTEKFKLNSIDYPPDNTAAIRRSGVYVGDIPGFQEQDGIKDDHIKFIMDGNVPDGYKIINGIQDTQRDLQRDPSPDDKIHCVCFVFDCVSILKGLSETMRTTIQHMLRLVYEKDYPHIVLLTKCDIVSHSWSTGRQRIFEDKNVRLCKDKIKEEFRFRQQLIFPIVNYEDQNVVDKQTDRLILAALSEILYLGKRYMDTARQVE